MRKARQRNKNRNHRRAVNRGRNDATRTSQAYFTSNFHWLLKLSIAKFFAPDRITFHEVRRHGKLVPHESYIEIIRPHDPFMIWKTKEVLYYNRIASWVVYDGVLWSSIKFNDVGGQASDFDFEVHGFSRGDIDSLKEILTSIKNEVEGIRQDGEGGVSR